MPYIKNEIERRQVGNVFAKFTRYFGKNFTGYLNLFLFYLAAYSCDCYADYRDFIGELEMAKLEIYRRKIAPYEDKKIIENGDVE